MRTPKTYSTPEAAEQVGLTVRIIDLWARERAIVAPSGGEPTPGSGTYRKWSESDLRVLQALRRLHQLNAPYDVLEPAATLLMRTPPRARDTRWLVASAKGAKVCTLRELPAAVSDECWVVRLSGGG